MIKVSIVIPVYKVEKYLPACLDSVLNQTLQDIEVICIDDASPDRCPEILDGYAARDPRVRVLHLPENHQQGYGRNRGTEMARGKYIYFLDSDDMIVPEAMEELYNLAERDQLDSIYFDSQVIFESKELENKNETYFGGRRGKYEDKVYSGRELFELFIEQRDWNCYVQRTFWKKEFLLGNEVFSPEHTEHEDEYFSFKGILLAQRVRYIPKVFFIRRYRGDSVMTRLPHPKDFHGYFVNYCAMVDLVVKTGYMSSGTYFNILHMYERMNRFYSLFEEKENPREWFQNKEELRNFYYYSFSQHIGDYYKSLIKYLSMPVPINCRIWIYGGGIVGRRVYHAFISNGYIVDGFLVSKHEGNPEVLFGRKVFQVDEVMPSEGRVAVIAAMGAAQKEMQQKLEALGWRYSVFIPGR